MTTLKLKTVKISRGILQQIPEIMDFVDYAVIALCLPRYLRCANIEGHIKEKHNNIILFIASNGEYDVPYKLTIKKDACLKDIFEVIDEKTFKLNGRIVTVSDPDTVILIKEKLQHALSRQIYRTTL